MSTTSFSGLNMSVFTAFGWAGEETAIKFALSQLDLFVHALHNSLPRAIQQELPAYGLSQENQGVYLAAEQDVESDAHIAFYARPLSLELQLSITNSKVLEKGLAAAIKDPVTPHRLVTELGSDWTLRIQQLQVDEETGETTFYQDLFKDSVNSFTPETAAAVLSKATYLNAQDNWVTPIFLSRRFPSEQVAAMGPATLRVMGEQIAALMPLFLLFSGRSARKPGKTKARAASKAKVAAPKVAPVEVEVKPEDEFTYVAELKPLHLRRGFVNLTPRHWPFFAINARTETRPVTVYYDGVYDRKSAVWRLQPDDQARVVLSPAVHEWLEDHFNPEDKIELTVRKLSDDEIQISLAAVD
jgi:hypothetical protein